jgi:SulP family sulfate permease
MARVRTTVRTTMQRLGLEHRVGAGNIHLTIQDAVRAATDLAAPRP